MSTLDKIAQYSVEFWDVPAQLSLLEMYHVEHIYRATLGIYFHTKDKRMSFTLTIDDAEVGEVIAEATWDRHWSFPHLIRYFRGERNTSHEARGIFSAILYLFHHPSEERLQENQGEVSYLELAKLILTHGMPGCGYTASDLADIMINDKDETIFLIDPEEKIYILRHKETNEYRLLFEHIDTNNLSRSLIDEFDKAFKQDELKSFLETHNHLANEFENFDRGIDFKSFQ